MSKQTLVMKFGGTSVGSAAALVNARQIIQDAKQDWARVVVVTSAMSGVTDLLLKSAALAVQGHVGADAQAKPPLLKEVESQLREKHFTALNALIKDGQRCEQAKAEINALILSLMDLCKAIAVLGEAS